MVCFLREFQGSFMVWFSTEPPPPVSAWVSASGPCVTMQADTTSTGFAHTHIPSTLSCAWHRIGYCACVEWMNELLLLGLTLVHTFYFLEPLTQLGLPWWWGGSWGGVAGTALPKARSTLVAWWPPELGPISALDTMFSTKYTLFVFAMIRTHGSSYIRNTEGVCSFC